jgi:hypothetical protein
MVNYKLTGLRPVQFIDFQATDYFLNIKYTASTKQTNPAR